MIPISRVVLLLLVLALGSGANAQTSAPRKVMLKDPNITSSLVLELSVNKQSYSLADDLNLTAMLRNEGSLERIFVYDWLGWGSGSGMILTIEDTSGHEVESPMDNLSAPRPPDDPAPLVGLRLGQVFGI